MIGHGQSMPVKQFVQNHIQGDTSGARFNCIKKHHEKHHENHHEKTSHQKVTIKKSNWTFVMIFVMIFMMIFFQLNWAPDCAEDLPQTCPATSRSPSHCRPQFLGQADAALPPVFLYPGSVAFSWELQRGPDFPGMGKLLLKRNLVPVPVTFRGGT